MSDPILEISCNFDTTDASVPLGLEVRLNNQTIFNVDHVAGLTEFKHSLSDADAEHCLEFVMKNKTDKDTVIDSEGNIVKDACLTISNLAFDGIELKQLFVDKAVYSHNFNGTQAETQDKFYGAMGCNGTVKLNFATPMYLWLLENM